MIRQLEGSAWLGNVLGFSVVGLEYPSFCSLCVCWKVLDVVSGVSFWCGRCADFSIWFVVRGHESVNALCDRMGFSVKDIGCCRLWSGRGAGLDGGCLSTSFFL